MALLYDGKDWTPDMLRRTYDAMEPIAHGEIGLSTYPNQIEVITSEQMLDAYSNHAMPQMYAHWRYGKAFAMHENSYSTGKGGLAYEVVINSNPCISYIMEENSPTMQALVIAHAAFGHNHFFKNNVEFRQWTDAAGILDYLSYAKRYVSDCEDKHGIDAVERILDAAHAMENHGVDRYKRHSRRVDEAKRETARREHAESTYDPIWTTLPVAALAAVPADERERAERAVRARMKLPEENLLYFVEKNAPMLKSWERELIRIVRKTAQYFYPQKQSQVNNEGCATWTHYEIMTKLHERGMISDGSFIEMLHSHSGVVNQTDYDSGWYGGWNPYALGYAIMRDISRICTRPTAEDREWFPAFAGNEDPYGTLRRAWAENRDESLVANYLSPTVMRDFRMFHVADRRGSPHLRVDAIHDDRGFRAVRRRLAASYDLSRREPDINVVDVNLFGDRRLVLQHSVLDGRTIDPKQAALVIKCMRVLWGYPVRLLERDAETDRVLLNYEEQ